MNIHHHSRHSVFRFA